MISNTLPHNRPHAGPLPEGEGACVDIEWIVREVIRRLREADLDTSLSRNAAPLAGTQRVAESLEITEPLITLSTIEKRLTGVRQLTVSRRAIVTPAVVDELKDRSIELVRCSKIAPKPSSTAPASQTNGPIVIVQGTQVDTTALSKQLPAAQVVQAESAIDQQIASIASHVARGEVAIVLTATPAAAVVAANRDKNIRAAVGFNFPAIRRAVDDAGANVLAIDPTSRSTSELAGLIGEFLRRTT